MLLIPAAVEKILERGRVQGRKEGREEEWERWKEAYRIFAFEIDGVRMLPETPEVREFLSHRGD